MSIVNNQKAHVSINNVSFSRFQRGEELKVLSNISISIAKGEFVSILGPSGSGKTTLLYLLAKILEPTEGSIVISDNEQGAIKTESGIVFQDYGLFGWRTVYENAKFPFDLMSGRKNKEYMANDKDFVCFLLEKVGLGAYKDFYPHQLSGGMKQRLAIARLLAANTQLFLMDEPLSALDYSTRKELQKLILDIWKEFNKTIILVTHSIDEAILFSNKIYIISVSPGKIEQEIIIDLPYPRNPASEEFQKYRAEVLSKL